jgi:hypothetical protein
MCHKIWGTLVKTILAIDKISYRLSKGEIKIILAIHG